MMTEMFVLSKILFARAAIFISRLSLWEHDLLHEMIAPGSGYNAIH
jgi:hypothetical protein